MSLPNKIQVNAITGASSPSSIDNDINNFKQAILDLFGIPDNTNISTALMTVNASGLDNVIFRNTAANPDTAGELQRNATDLKFHNGSGVRTLATLEDNQTFSGGFTLTSNAINITAGTEAVIGTTDAQDMSVKANGTSRLTVKSGGQVLLNHNLTTGANAGDIVLANAGAVRFANQAGTTSANYGIVSNSSNNLIYDTPTSSNHQFSTNGQSFLLLDTQNSGPVVTFLAECSSDPSAPSANRAVLYIKDNGGGNTQLCTRFSSGNVVTLATQGGTSPVTMTLGTPTSATGTALNFTGLPAGLKRITIHFVGVSTDGTDNWLVQLGDSGGIETSGYLGGGTAHPNGSAIVGANSTAGFIVASALAANVVHGVMTLNLVDAANNTWAAAGVFGASSSGATFVTGGSKSTSATLDRLRITTTGGTQSFDAGTINISYE